MNKTMHFNISSYSLKILYNSKFILMAPALETNIVVITKVYFIVQIGLLTLSASIGATFTLV